jgi:hypothetical protein
MTLIGYGGVGWGFLESYVVLVYSLEFVIVDWFRLIFSFLSDVFL